MISDTHLGATYDHLVLEEGDSFRVHTRAYSDADVFEHEMRTIFENNWVYVAHESEIAQPGDYRTSAVGRMPVIVTRSSENEVHVLLEYLPTSWQRGVSRRARQLPLLPLSLPQLGLPQRWRCGGDS